MRDLAVVKNRSEIDPPQDRPVAMGVSRIGQRGQLLIIFACALITLMMLMAIVVDIGWYWSNGLKIQRAADAAALAGAVYLPDPGDGTGIAKAQAAALLAAKRNGYVPGPTTTLTSVVDGNNPRQLDVAITDKVGTFFLKVAGIQTLNAGRSSKAEFVLPVPMGSPQNYYGVGTFVNKPNLPPLIANYVNPSTYTTQTTGVSPSANTQTGATGTAWTTPDNVYASDAAYATVTTNLQQTVWTGFSTGATPAGFGSFQSGAIIDGVVLNLQAKMTTSGMTCQIKAEVSWDGGTTWGSAAQTSANIPLTEGWLAPLGSSSNAAIWGANAVWTPSVFTTANEFQVRLTFMKGTCVNASLNEITAVVYSHTSTPQTPVNTTQVINGPTGAALTSQGFWGADITQGGSRENGDQWGPANDNLKGVSNPDFDGKGVDYTVQIAGSSGQLQLFDPTFCETGPIAGAGNYGAGDHWISGSANPVTTVYALYNERGTPYDPTDDGAPVATSGNLFAAKTQADYSGVYGTPGHSGLTDCSGDPYHNAWYQLASGLPTGTYRLNVTTSVAGNVSTNAENMWSAWVTSASGSSQVFGQGKMVAYNNLVSGLQTFYLAQIDKVHAGKTMEIKLFDPGDVGGNAYLKILSPDGNVYSYVSNFSYSADNEVTGVGPQIQTASGGSSFFQDALITIEIPLPATYGATGLTPPGETSPGWWKIEYNVTGGNDTTSWQVDITGNPVHLLVP